MTAAVVGVLRIGAAYVPIDVAYPEERQRYIFDNSGARVLIALPGDSGIGGVPCVAITIDGELDGEPACSVRVAPGAPAYVIYTSGSTGLPKGVVMTRRALANLIRWEIWHGPRATAEDAAVLAAQLRRVVSGNAVDLGARRDAGAGRRAGAADPDALWCALVEHAVSRIYLPYVALQQLADAARRWDGAIPPLAEVVTAGEQLIVTAAIVALFERLESVWADRDTRRGRAYAGRPAYRVAAATADRPADPECLNPRARHAHGAYADWRARRALYRGSMRGERLSRAA